jgi:hypothetical protein
MSVYLPDSRVVVNIAGTADTNAAILAKLNNANIFGNLTVSGSITGIVNSIIVRLITGGSSFTPSSSNVKGGLVIITGGGGGGGGADTLDDGDDLASAGAGGGVWHQRLADHR